MIYNPPPLRITSPDGHSWLELRPFQDESGYYDACEFDACIDYGNSSFRGVNRDVQFLNLQEFQSDFDRFIMDRSLRPSLNGTYDCLAMFHGQGTKVHLQFCLGDAFCGGALPVQETRIRGAFAVDGEQLNAINAFFEACRPIKFP
jgi:hypothetical protein